MFLTAKPQIINLKPFFFIFLLKPVQTTLRQLCGMSHNKSSREEGVFDDNFSYFSSKPYVVTPHLNRLIESVQMRGHNLCFYAELTKNIPNYHQILSLS